MNKNGTLDNKKHCTTRKRKLATEAARKRKDRKKQKLRRNSFKAVAVDTNKSKLPSVGDFFHMELRDFRRKIENDTGIFDGYRKNLGTALALYYVNSGCCRFQQEREYCVKDAGATVDIDVLAKEIRGEAQTAEEIGEMVARFCNLYDSGARLMGCGACGVRMYERTDCPKILYKKTAIANLRVLEYSESEREDLEQVRRTNFEISIPTDGMGGELSIAPWKGRSVFISEKEVYYHLHQELVWKEGEQYWTDLCPKCSQNCEKGEVPPFSIAAGVDFGDYRRLGLAAPNLHEQIIMSRYRLIQSAMKFTSACEGERFRCHAVLFAHDAPETACRLLSGEEMFGVDNLKDTLKLVLVEENGKVDGLLKRVRGLTTVVGRPWVVYQWLLVLKQTNAQYKTLDVPPYEVVRQRMDEANAAIWDGISIVEDERLRKAESSMGDDVAKQLGEERDGHTTEGIQYTYVTDRQSFAELEQDQKNVACLKAIRHVVGEEDGSNQESVNIRDVQSRQNDEIEEGRKFSNMMQVDGQQYALAVNRAREEMEEEIRARKRQKEKHWCRRSGEIVDDLSGNDTGMGGGFPMGFLLGTAYGKPPGMLSKEERHHLLCQYTGVFGNDRRLLCYLFDVKKRYNVMCGVNAHVRTDPRSIAVIKQLMEDGEELNAIHEAIKNPGLKKSRTLVKKYLKHITFGGKDIAYSPTEMAKLKSMLSESTRRYGPCSAMLTLSFSDVDNIRGIRASARTTTNRLFPAKPSESGDLKELMEQIRQCSERVSCGEIKLPEGKYTKAKRRCLVNENPVAFVTESKQMIADVCSLLLGMPPEEFYGYYEAQSQRSTRYYAKEKSILGHCQGYIGVVEDHQRGTLHYHLLFFGGLSPYLLQRFSGVEALCESISTVLDKMVCSTIPVKTQLPFLIRSIFDKQNFLGLRFNEIGDQGVSPQLDFLRREELKKGTARPVELLRANYTDRQGCQQQTHSHTDTCKKGFMGATGCRFCIPAGRCDKTKPVLLRPKKTENGEDITYDVDDNIGEEHSPGIYCLADPLDMRKGHEDVIVWETKRQTTKEDEYYMVPESFSSREETEEWFKSRLKGEPGYAEDSAFWKWLRTVHDEKLKIFVRQLRERMEKVNGYIACFSPILSGCTGSHNHINLLGSIGQAKGGTFYIVPYFGKLKFPLAVCLSILNEVVHYVKQYPSKADDSGTHKRTAQHVYQRVLNRLMLKMELSDFQIVADLLGLPCIIRSEVYSYLDPVACMTYANVMQGEEDCERRACEILERLNGNDDESNDDKDDANAGYKEEKETDEGIKGVLSLDGTETLGRIETFVYHTEDGRSTRELVPACMLYENRGEGLKDLSRYEYAALIKTTRGTATASSYDKARRFEFAKEFTPGCQYCQLLRTKQATVIVTRKAPPHPGKKDDDQSPAARAKWEEKANAFAMFYLTIFRPEVECYSSAMINTYGYSWKDFEDWISELQNDSLALSKFRLQQLHTRIQGFYTPYATKRILSLYRGRERDIWEEGDKDKLKGGWGKYRETDVLDEFLYRQQHAEVRNAELRRWEEQCQFDKSQSNRFKESCGIRAGDVQKKWPRSVSDSCILDIEKMAELASIANDIKKGPTKVELELMPHFYCVTREDEVFSSDGAILNRDQREIMEVYEAYFEDNSRRPPPIVLLHGAAGTGKSHVISAIISAGESTNHKIIRTSFNAINAIALRGYTTAWLVSLYATVHCNRETELTEQGRIRLENEAENASLIIVDEVSNIAPWVLARISNSLCQVLNQDLPFGGIPILLVGDLSQMEPVKAGLSLTQSVLDIAGVRRGKCYVRKTTKKKTDALKGATDRKVPVQGTNGIPTAEDRYCKCHPYTIGASLFSECRWFELNTDIRSHEDERHSKIVHKLYKEGKITLSDMQLYKELMPSDLSDPDSPWLKASVIVSTNRERFTLTHDAAVRFAKATGKLVYRWRSNWSKWKGAPARPGDEIYEDPCFFEYFVEGAEGFLNTRISQWLNLVNATPFTYHSMAVYEEEDRVLIENKKKTAASGSVVTLAMPPSVINIAIDPFGSQAYMYTHEQRQYFRMKKLQDQRTGKVVIPITKGNGRETEDVIVHGTEDCAPSKITVKGYFPMEMAFAITVNKAQGRTIRRVILALSKRPSAVCNMGLKEIYVALSRVRESSHIRLLLEGSNYADRWSSLSYLQELKKDDTVDAFFAGFCRPLQTNEGWKGNRWNEDAAWANYEKRVGEDH